MPNICPVGEFKSKLHTSRRSGESLSKRYSRLLLLGDFGQTDPVSLDTITLAMRPVSDHMQLLVVRESTESRFIKSLSNCL